MLRVGLTGGLGGGKTTVAQMFAELGAQVIAADEIGRQLMRPGQPVYRAILRRFGEQVVSKDGSLDRRALAQLAFHGHQADALNRIVHPAVIAAEEEWTRNLFAQDPTAIAIVESALIFEAARRGTAPGWLDRFDKLILVTAPEETKIARYVERGLAGYAGPAGKERLLREALERDARERLAAQIPDNEKAVHCDYVIANSDAESFDRTREEVGRIYRDLQAAGRIKQLRENVPQQPGGALDN